MEAGGGVLESPEDKRTAATAGVGRRGRGHRSLPRARCKPGFYGNCPETWPRVRPLPLSSAVLFERAVLVLPGAGLGAGRRHVTGTPGTLSLTQQLIMGSLGPFVITAAIPWVDGVDFLPLPLPQPCQIAFVSEGNRVENVTLQMEKLQALPV